METYCKGAGGCRIAVNEGYLSVTSVATGAKAPPQSCFGLAGSRVAVTAVCATRMFLGGSKSSKRPHFMVYTEAAVVSGTSEAGTVMVPLETVFHIHSDPAAPSDSYGIPYTLYPTYLYYTFGSYYHTIRSYYHMWVSICVVIV